MFEPIVTILAFGAVIVGLVLLVKIYYMD